MRLGRIILYPVKSLDGVSVPEARIAPGGYLEGDRVYAIFNAEGKHVNGKREPKIHGLRSRFDADLNGIEIWAEGSAAGTTFALAEPAPLGRWLSDYLGYAVGIRHDTVSGFPDDREAFGPTIVSTPSLGAVAGWFPGLDVESARRRFRANLELDAPDAPPFVEDELFGAAGERKPFAIGEVRLLGHNPCQRCVVPTRDPWTGAPIAKFQLEFMARRKECLPPWADASRFNHFYRFAVNTSIEPSEAGKRLRVGDGLN
jgi:uncharacterized protein YcbX